MRIDDLGHFDEDVVLFGGPVSNLAATRALITVVADRPAICTGDVVAYCADAADTVAALRATGWPVIAGNCERQLAENADDCGCGFGADTTCDLLSRAWYAHARDALSDEDRAWMAALPDAAVFTHATGRWGVLHGGARQINRFLWPSGPDTAFAEEFAALEAETGPLDGIVAGHCGLAFERQIGGKRWLNAGSIGMPPHDGRAQTRYAVLTPDGAHIQRLDYDHAPTIAAMTSAGLTQGYHATLETGLWPSEDVLPAELRR